MIVEVLEKNAIVSKKENKRLEELKAFFKKIEDELNLLEKERMLLELTLIENNIDELEHHEVSSKLILLLQKSSVKPLASDAFLVLNRMYDIAKFGCKSSCMSSANILLETEHVLKGKSHDDYEFISVKGHMAPFMYANEYTQSNFSLLYLYALHHSNIISPIVRNSYTSQGIDATYNLGYGLGKVLSKMMVNPNKKYVVLMGDSDLTFGATLEALMYIKTQNYNNITLIIDFNKFGFEARPDGFDTSILRSFFNKTIEIDEKDLKNNRAFEETISDSKRTAIFINTQKENHKIQLFSAKNQQDTKEIKLTKYYGETVAKLNQTFQKELCIFTPDLASRFHLQENNLTYINTTVSEVLTPILALGQDKFTAIATDQKYSTNMIGSLLELYKGSASVLLTLAKSWDYWGGEANALNILNTLPDTTVYEPCCKNELEMLLRMHYEYPLYKTIISIADVELPVLEIEPQLKGANKLINKGSKTLIVSFGIATALVHKIAEDKEIDLIHFAKMRMSYSAELQEILDTYEHVYLMEYNGIRNGFSEHFLSVYNIKNYSIKASMEEIPQLKAKEQIEYHGFSYDKLETFLTDNIEVK